jgi:hypothetical protein
VTWVGGQWQPVSQVKGAKLGANVTSRRATSGHRQPLSVQVSHHRATPTAFPRRTKCAYAAAGQRLAAVPSAHLGPACGRTSALALAVSQPRLSLAAARRKACHARARASATSEAVTVIASVTLT